MNTSLRMLGVVVCAVAVAACGGGGGGAADTGPEPGGVSTLGAAHHELGNVSSILSLTGAMAPGGFATSTSAGTQTVQAKSLTTQTQSCGTGGSVTNSQDSKSRAFAFYAVSPSVNFTTQTFSNCAYSDSFKNGVTEYGSGTVSGDPHNYFYEVDGQGSTPLVANHTSGADTFSDQFTGTFEGFETSGNATSVKANELLNHDQTVSGAHTFFSLQLGDGSTPLTVAADDTGALTFDGTYTYASTKCAGGTYTLTTPTSVVLTEDPTTARFYPTSGVIVVSSNGKSMTVTFASDNSATVSYSAGGSDALTAAQVQGILDTPPCGL